MEYYNGQLCIPARQLIGNVMTESNYKQMVLRGKLDIARQGKGLGNYALVVVDTLPERYKVAVKELYQKNTHNLKIVWVV